MDAREHIQTNLRLLRETLAADGMSSARQLISSLHPAEVARLLESVPLRERALIWEMIDVDDQGDILVEVNEEIRHALIQGMDAAQLVAATEGMALDDLADLVAYLPETVIQQILHSLDAQDQIRLNQVLSYDEDSAGGLMNVDVVTVRADVTLGVVLRYLRTRGGITDGTDSIYVVNRNNEFVGSLFLSRLLTVESERLVEDVMSTNVTPIFADAPSEVVVWEFEHRDLLSAPVVDDHNRVVGRITVDDVVDVIRDEAEHSMMSAAGLDEEDDMFAPVIKSSRRRTIWLGVNLMTAFLAASVVDLFQSAVDKVVLLAVLMPVVPSMGGVAGSQTLIIITRAMALGQIDRSNAVRILRKEMLVGVLNGLGWSLVVGLVTYFWFKDWRLGAVIAAAMVINLVMAAGAGFSIPLLLKRMKIDPAIAGGVVLTTVTDVTGYMVFLGLGAWYLL